MTLNRETQEAARNAIQDLSRRHAVEIQNLSPSAGSDRDEQLNEQIDELRKAKEGLESRIEQEEAAAKRNEQIADQAEALQEMFRTEFEEEKRAKSVDNDVMIELQRKFDDLSARMYARPPTPPLSKSASASSSAHDDIKRELEESRNELISARGEIKDLKVEI